MKEIEDFCNKLQCGKHPHIRSTNDKLFMENIFIKWNQIKPLFKEDNGFNRMDKLISDILDERFRTNISKNKVIEILSEFSCQFRKNIIIPRKITGEKVIVDFSAAFTPEHGYSEISAFEKRIRTFIKDKLVTEFGTEKWYVEGIPKEIRKNIQEKRDKDIRECRKAEPILNYADFSDYYQIIERNWDNIFSQVFGDKDKTRVRFTDLNNLLRISIMHTKNIDVNEIGHSMFTKNWIDKKISGSSISSPN